MSRSFHVFLQRRHRRAKIVAPAMIEAKGDRTGDAQRSEASLAVNTI
jgi:hypothetical protein